MSLFLKLSSFDILAHVRTIFECSIFQRTFFWLNVLSESKKEERARARENKYFHKGQKQQHSLDTVLLRDIKKQRQENAGEHIRFSFLYFEKRKIRKLTEYHLSFREILNSITKVL